MTNEVRRTAVVSEYMEMIKTSDEEACLSYLTECFGDSNSEDFDKEGFDTFTKEVLAAAREEAKVEVENVTESNA